VSWSSMMFTVAGLLEANKSNTSKVKLSEAGNDPGFVGGMYFAFTVFPGCLSNESMLNTCSLFPNAFPWNWTRPSAT